MMLREAPISSLSVQGLEYDNPPCYKLIMSQLDHVTDSTARTSQEYQEEHNPSCFSQVSTEVSTGEHVQLQITGISLMLPY